MRTRRHTSGGLGPTFDWTRGSPWRRFARDLGLVGLTALLGYVITTVWMAPESAAGSDHSVPRVLELPVDKARAELSRLGFRIRLEAQRTSPDVARGAVLWQDPPPETILPPGTTVQLTVSDGPAPVIVPDVVGLSLPYAERILNAAGVKVGDVDTVRAAPEPGVVMSVRPPPGNGRPRGSSVDLLVSGGEGGGS
ncbi:MAG TPA: PASTA domain-containing protein [Gemmatimonadales bacterium]|nr:PASTA domain-containing protein [Gemmatimonadales bacterium]